MDEESEIDLRQRGLENFIVIVLGAYDRSISLLHLEKEVFLLWNFHPEIKEYLKFIKHYRGPFSKDIQETILHPVYLEDLWNYEEPKRSDSYSGGYVRLTNKGKLEYKRLLDKIKKDDDMLHLLAGIQIVRQLYDKLSMEELLLLIYDTYPEYTERSNVYNTIFSKRSKLLESLLKKGFIDNERAELFNERRC